jgi:HEAT repeat protein
VVGDLVALLTGPDPLPAYWAATLLGRLGEGASAAVAALATTLGAADLAVRERCAWALGKIGPAAGAARDALRRSAAGSDERLARLASEALTAIGG